MINFILGGAYCDKDNYIWNLIEKSTEKNKKIMLIVPEQFSFESEVKAYQKLSYHKAKNLEVFSFTRLSTHIFKSFGGIARNYVDNTSRAILMGLSINQIKDGLKVYEKLHDKTSFSKNILEMINEFKNNNITYEKLEQAIPNIKNQYLKQKTQDISLIYSTYDELLNKNFNDNFDDLNIACDKIENTSFFEDYIVIFDEFVNFNNSQYNMVKNIIKNSQQCYFQFFTSNKKSNLFKTINETYNKVKNIARENNVKVNSPIFLEDIKINKELKFLEKNILREVYDDYNDQCNNIKIISCKNEYDEIEYIASTIRELVTQNGYKFSDIAILSRDIETYKRIIKNVFKKYKISFYMDDKKNMTNFSLYNFADYLLRSSINFDTQEILGLIKCGVIELDIKDVSLLENYIFVWDIKGKMWTQQFTQNPDGYSKEFTNFQKQKLNKINEIREYIINGILQFKENSRNNILSISKNLYNSLEYYNIKQKIEKEIFELEKMGQYDLANLQKQSYDSFINILDILTNCLEKVKISIKDYIYYFELASLNCEIGQTPQMQDTILIGDAKRAVLNNIKILFVIGVNKDIFPMIPKDGTIYNSLDKKMLKDCGFDFIKSNEYLILQERFISYRTLCYPSQKLYLSYRKSDISGQSLLQSEIIDQVKQMFDEDIVYDTQTTDYVYYIRNNQTCFIQLANHLKTNTEFTKTANFYLSQNEKYKKKLEILQNAGNQNNEKIENNNIALDLFGKNMNLSPSSIEKYYECKFKYFCNKGLNIYPRKKAELNPLETGNLIHHCLYILVKNYDEIFKLSQDNLKKYIIKMLDEYIENFMGGANYKDNKFMYFYNKFADVLYEIILNIKQEQEQSLFKPIAFEYKINDNSKIKPLVFKSYNGDVKIIGTVDRIDIYKNEKEKFVRVLDYKSGKKQFNLQEAWAGLNLQMLIYLFSIWKNGLDDFDKLTPSGILYLPTKKLKIAETDKRYITEDEIKKAKSKQFISNGLFLKNINSLKAMEQDLSGKFIPIKMGKETYDKNSDKSLVNITQMQQIYDRIEKLVLEMVNNLHSGQIKPYPIKETCEYCDYKSVCGIQDDIEYRDILELDKKQMFEQDGGVNKDESVD